MARGGQAEGDRKGIQGTTRKGRPPRHMLAGRAELQPPGTDLRRAKLELSHEQCS